MNKKPQVRWVDPSGNNLPTTELAEAIYETLIEECVAHEDPYEIYMSRMRSQMYADTESVSARISEGYRQILANLDL